MSAEQRTAARPTQLESPSSLQLEATLARDLGAHKLLDIEHAALELTREQQRERCEHTRVQLASRCTALQLSAFTSKLAFAALPKINPQVNSPS